MDASFFHSRDFNPASSYGLLALLGITLSLLYWTRAAKGDSRMLPIYLGSLAGAFVGAKLSYLLSEGFFLTGPDRWIAWLYGKSITGALLGGYFGVEFGKYLVGYKKPTGDRFALIVPLAITIGRLGCLTHGCCQGILLGKGVLWPAVEVEIAFNLLAWVVLFNLRSRPWATSQLFHLYLIAYGIFRVGHEFLRTTPKILGPVSGYQIFALALIVLGSVGFYRRKKGTKKEGDTS
ncbi:prolipoprotein diacylglyceryl transferase family protein [Verrucomicrobiaceae bacterium 227]